MCLTEQEIVWDTFCAKVCEACMDYGYSCECGYHMED